MIRRMNRVFLGVVACGGLLLATSWALAQDKAAPSAEKLTRLLQKHPEADANKDGTLTAEEAQAYFKDKGGFGKGGPGGRGPMGFGDPAQMLKMHPDWDTNKDGTLSEDEIKAGREAMRNMTREEMAAQILKQHPEADTDGDGVLSPEEFAAFHKGRPGGPPAAPWAGLDRLIEQFAKADLDGNGQLSKEELIKFRQQFGPPPGAGAGPGMGFGGFGPPDGRPIPEKARAKMLENHPEADTDKDGKLSDAEMKAFWEQNRGKSGLGKGPADKAGKGPGEGKGRHGKGAKAGQDATGQ